MKEGTVFWITGLSGAGKSTLALDLQSGLRVLKENSIILDGDELRQVFDKTLDVNNDYTPESRLKLANQYSNLASLLASQGFNVIVATISMFEEIYNKNRNNISNYIEIFIDTPISVLKERDTKSIYKKHHRLDLSQIAGLDIEVDIPQKPDLIIKYCKNNSNNIYVRKIINIWKNMIN